MKVTNILHALGALGCIGGIFGLASMGWQVWQWPAIALLWLANSYINAISAHRYRQDTHNLHKEKLDMIEELTKADMRAWDAEMRLAKVSKK